MLKQESETGCLVLKKSGANERNIAYSWMFDLSMGDTVYLAMSSGGLHAESGDSDQVHFTGHLLHAN